MNILVCVSKVPDTTAKITFKDNDTAFNEDGVQFILNPADEWYALVKALELKEEAEGTVDIVSVGKSDYDVVIRKAIALGADNAFRIDTNGEDPFYTASQIAAFAKDKNYDLILTGSETINYNNGSVGGMLAALLDMPFISMATSMEVQNSTAALSREIEGGEELIEAPLPLLVSCMKGMAEQRIPNMRGIIASRRKKIEVVPPADSSAQTTVQKFKLPPAKSGVKMVDTENLEELIKLLHEEAKVI